MTHALILIDFINDIVAEGGKLAGEGYTEQIASRGVVQAVSKLREQAATEDWLVAHVRVAFSPSYVEHPADSPLMGAARTYGALMDGEWGTAFDSRFAPGPNEIIVTKRRVSPFCGTDLDLILRTHGVTHLHGAGVATDLAMQSFVREAHDRDYQVHLHADACAAASLSLHEASLTTLGKLCDIRTGA